VSSGDLLAPPGRSAFAHSCFEKKQMNFRNLPAVILISLSLFSASCSLSSTSEESLDMPDISLEKGTMGNEVVFDDSATENQGGQVSTFSKDARKTSRTAPDGKIDVIQDKVGNTMEVRYFNNHPNLTQITIITRPDGTKDIVAIGHNRENKRIPPEMSDQALTFTGRQIADLAGIHTTRQTRSNRSMDGRGPQPPPTPIYQTPTYQNTLPVQPQTTQGPTQTQIPPAAEQEKSSPPDSQNQSTNHRDN
jgi:hypothetical protein